ncbi:unnamed protein product [Acanthoscelides obtectus]|uniref:Uncharacterized protein n=1 Tax=Acanthoscelides obtectus TaxID=200917 RepID=A0A9P0L8R3_ACAOB|nr:unnamed protein product [Acanthoscelides obtectus]CAK1630925.1 hypothetical protein AOBTE_LOCUS6645 [Acanthoscelides obtectus]
MKLLLGLVIIFCSTGLLKCSITICKKKVPKFPVSYNDIQSTMKDLVIGDKDIHIDHTSFNFTHPAIRFQMINFNIAATMEWPPYVNTTAICATSDVDVSVQQVKNHFYNLMGDPELEELMNDAMESLGPEMVQILWKEFKEFYGDYIRKIIEDIINGNKFTGITSHVLQATVQNLKQLDWLPGISDLIKF